MGNNKTLAVDIDGCVCTDVGFLWWYYLKSRYTLKPEYLSLKYNWEDVKLPYNLTELFDMSEEQTNGFEWWDNANLYDGMVPRLDSIQYLGRLSEEGWDIVFVSKTVGCHGCSKERFIKKWFPFAKACILTSEKQYVRCNAIVDDYVVNLNNMPDDVKLFRFRKDYYQKEEAVKPMKLIYGFEDLYNELKGGKRYE
jgi:hypothetical protein